MKRSMQDPSIICESCSHEVRPIQLDLGDDLTCPNCGKEVTSEVERYNLRYELDKMMGDDE